MIGIVILNYNNSTQTLECLESLHRCCRGGNYKVCLVDNASRAGELEKLKAECREHIIVAGQNRGYACGNDLGCEWFDKDTDIDKILILNDDTRFTEDILTPMEAYLDNHPECGVVFPLVKDPDGNMDKACARRQKSAIGLFLQASCLGKFGLNRTEFISREEIGDADRLVTQVPPGSCMMLPKNVFKEIGWLDPNTFLYFEEHILGEKLAGKGLQCVLLPRISIIHLGAATTSKQPSKTVYAHWRNSYLYFMRTYTHIPCAVRKWLEFRTWLKTLA